MKKYILFIFIISFGFKSYSQTILNSFPAPTSGCGDLAFDGEHLWIGGQAEYQLFQLSTIDGTVIRTIPTSVRSPYGLTFDGSDLWVSDTENDSIQRIDTLNGNIISTFISPKSIPSNLEGLAWDGNNVWVNDFGEFNGGFDNYVYDSTFVLNNSGSSIQAYASIGQGPTGLAFGEGYLYSADSETDQIYIINASNYTVLDSFPVVGGTHPNGLAWDGNSLWLANNDSDSIYQLDVSLFTAAIPDHKGQNIEVSVYPNPSVNYINIVANSTIEKVELVDAKGRIVYPPINSTSNTSYSLDISSLNNGLYFLSVLVNKTKTTKLILKQ